MYISSFKNSILYLFLGYVFFLVLFLRRRYSTFFFIFLLYLHGFFFSEFPFSNLFGSFFFHTADFPQMSGILGLIFWALGGLV